VIEAKPRSIPWSRVTVQTVGHTRIVQPRAAFYPMARAALYPMVKRWLDAVMSVCLLVLLAPVLTLIVLAVRLDSPGPAIFRQKRVGRLGREFTLFKFRSMHNHADEDVHRKFVKGYINGFGCKAGGHVVFKPSADSRVTRVGIWLRRTSLDELPQLMNVLRGEMSLVGPRPSIGYEVAEYSDWHLQRLAVTPGMTGLAQISGRSGLTFEKIVRLDLQYIERRSLAVDLGILLRTIPVVLRAKCAA
jgi:lipopolysaccharide/colanic/teichoic acid biosynthesis glycosyltransferase